MDPTATHRVSLSWLSTRQHHPVSYNDDDARALRLLGDNLRRLREAAGKSQDALANDSGLHRTYVGAVERGERNPTYITLVKYASGLGLSVSDLVETPR
jgi:DNA-binding XRE family transcriptional regulator